MQSTFKRIHMYTIRVRQVFERTITAASAHNVDMKLIEKTVRDYLRSPKHKNDILTDDDIVDINVEVTQSMEDIDIIIDKNIDGELVLQPNKI